jgi:hypothetical protein
MYARFVQSRLLFSRSVYWKCGANKYFRIRIFAWFVTWHSRYNKKIYLMRTYVDIPRSRRNDFLILRISTLWMSGRVARSSLFFNFELFASFCLMLSLLKVDLIRMKLPLIKLQLIAHLHIEFFLSNLKNNMYQHCFAILSGRSVDFDTLYLLNNFSQ